MQTIKGEDYIVRFDDEKGILYGIYGAVACGEASARIYMSIGKFVRDIGIENVSGLIFDMRRVEEFGRDNLASMQRESFSMERKYDMSHVPTAFVVDTAMQERVVRMLIGATPGQIRKSITYSLAEARTFLDEWHTGDSAGV